MYQVCQGPWQGHCDHRCGASRTREHSRGGEQEAACGREGRGEPSAHTCVMALRVIRRAHQTCAKTEQMRRKFAFAFEFTGLVDMMT